MTAHRPVWDAGCLEGVRGGDISPQRDPTSGSSPELLCFDHFQVQQRQMASSSPSKAATV